MSVCPQTLSRSQKGATDFFVDNISDSGMDLPEARELGKKSVTDFFVDNISDSGMDLPEPREVGNGSKKSKEGKILARFKKKFSGKVESEIEIFRDRKLRWKIFEIEKF